MFCVFLKSLIAFDDMSFCSFSYVLPQFPMILQIPPIYRTTICAFIKGPQRQGQAAAHDVTGLLLVSRTHV